MLDAGTTPTRGRAPLGGASRVVSPTAVAMGHEVMAGQLEKQAALAKGTARTLQQLNAKASVVCAAWSGVGLASCYYGTVVESRSWKCFSEGGMRDVNTDTTAHARLIRRLKTLRR